MMSTRIFALVDCNNFFVSCERLFRPDLEDRPVVVLSSNDGCAVSRSSEAKALSIPMGAPAFKYKLLFKQHGVTVLSANFELYGDISKRIVNLLTSVSARTEVYSIDESFLDLTTLAIADYEAWGRALRARILHEIGIPVSIGIASSKTLAKLANHRAKQDQSSSGVCYITDDTREAHLATYPLSELWGIGWRLAPQLQARGMATALDIAQAETGTLSTLMGVRGKQLQLELRGISCYPLELSHKPQQQIMRGRTFGKDTNSPAVINAAIAAMTSVAAFRLRTERQVTSRLAITIETNRHKPGHRRWHEELILPTATNDTGLMIEKLMARFNERIQTPGNLYHRLNIFLLDLAPEAHMQLDMIGGAAGQLSSSKRSQAVDMINHKNGRGSIVYASEKLADSWRSIKQHGSQRYTTHWEELPKARILDT